MLEKKERIFFTKIIDKRETDKKAFDKEFWSKVDPKYKFEAAWQMVIDSEILKGNKDFASQKTDRTVVRIFKRNELDEEEK
jgi:hypothetical protein